MRKRGSILQTILFIGLAGCASASRGCSSCGASTFGADWVVVQMDNDGRPYRCWEMRGVSIDGESNDGIYWKSNDSGNLVHIMGHVNRVQVVDGDWNHAFHELGLTQATCAEIHGQTYDPVTRTFATPHLVPPAEKPGAETSAPPAH